MMREGKCSLIVLFITWMTLINISKMKRRFVLLLLLCIVHISGYAKITLPGYFTDNMVLQQQTKVLISGQSSGQGGVELRVGWDKKVYKADIGTSGEWSIEVETPKAGGPYDIVLSDGEECFLHNVLIGEVWLCSGQSNMEMPLAGWGKVMNYAGGYSGSRLSVNPVVSS